MADQAPMTDRAEDRRRLPALPRAVGVRHGSLVMAGMLALTGLIFVWQASMLDLGRPGLPGAGFFPLALGLLLVMFSVVIGIGDWRRSVSGESLEFGHPQVLITLAALLAVPLLFEPLGGYVTLGLLSTVLLVLVARVSIVLSVLWSIVGMAACWYLFQELLGVRLPMGPF